MASTSERRKKKPSTSQSRREHSQRVLAEKKAEEVLNQYFSQTCERELGILFLFFRLRGDTEFVCDVQFNNALPDIPCDPKFIP